MWALVRLAPSSVQCPRIFSMPVVERSHADILLFGSSLSYFPHRTLRVDMRRGHLLIPTSAPGNSPTWLRRPIFCLYLHHPARGSFLHLLILHPARLRSCSGSQVSQHVRPSLRSSDRGLSRGHSFLGMAVPPLLSYLYEMVSLILHLSLTHTRWLV